MLFFWLQSILDVLLFTVYISISLMIFIAYQKADISSTQELFPEVWLLSGLFFLFRGMQNGFEVLIRFSVIEVEASIMQMIFKTIILFILFLILLVIRQSYDYLIHLSQVIAKVKESIKKGE